MKTIRFFALCAICVCAFGCQKGGKYTLSVAVPDEWNGGKAYLAYYNGRQLQQTDSAQIDNGMFVFDGRQDTAVYRLLKIEKQGKRPLIMAPVVIEAGEIRVSFDGNNAIVGGTPLNDILQQYFDIEKVYEPRMDSLYVAYMQTDNSDVERIRAIETEFDSLDMERSKQVVTFVEANADNAAGAYAFVHNYRSLSDEQQAAIIDKAGENFMCQPGVKPIADHLAIVRHVAVGQPFADLTMQNLNGDTVRLSDFVGKGRYVVVDFWASWCRPCRRAMPQLKSIYKKYGDKIEIVGVSFDNNEAAWKQCVAELELSWQHMSDLKGWQSAAAETYGIDAIPHLMLITPDGIIAAKKLTDESLDEKLRELIH